jgi:voltage-gated potassium channel
MTPARRYFEYSVRVFVFYSIAMYLAELEVTKGGRSQGFWLWNERVVATFFTVEYLARWFISDQKRHFPFKLLSVIDLLAVLPFYAGFFVDEHTLELIRTLRVLRMFKLVRYNPALLNVLDGIRRVKKELYVVGYVVVIIVVFSSVLILQFEKHAQPDKFDKTSDALWWSFVTMATVGYGDLSPVTIGGRIVAVCTMIVGIGIFGVFVSLVGSALVTSWKEQSANSPS